MHWLCVAPWPANCVVCMWKCVQVIAQVGAFSLTSLIVVCSSGCYKTFMIWLNFRMQSGVLVRAYRSHREAARIWRTILFLVCMYVFINVGLNMSTPVCVARRLALTVTVVCPWREPNRNQCERGTADKCVNATSERYPVMPSGTCVITRPSVHNSYDLLHGWPTNVIGNVNNRARGQQCVGCIMYSIWDSVLNSFGPYGDRWHALSSIRNGNLQYGAHSPLEADWGG